ncbi:hypothetical protein KJA15_04500 [Patescibacteria group bacterium]|nr:hypothetical protein [Patescibacteria group bacterium]
MFTDYLTEQIIKKDLQTQYMDTLIPCAGYQYLSILTDGAFNPHPYDPTNFLLHFFILKNSNRTFPIFGEMRNIPIKGNTEIHYSNLANTGDNATVESGYGNIIFYLSNYPNDFMSLKGNIGIQWEKSFTVAMDEHKYYHFGIIRVSEAHTLAIPFIPKCFNKLVYLYKETALTQAKEICYYYEDCDKNCIDLAVDTLTELLLPTKRFYLHFQANASADSDFNIMLKFLKA